MKKILFGIILFWIVLTPLRVFADTKCDFELNDKISMLVVNYLYDKNYHYKKENFDCFERVRIQRYFSIKKINNKPEAISKVIKLNNGIKKLDISDFSERRLEIYNIVKWIINEAYKNLYIHEWYVYTVDNFAYKLDLSNIDNKYWIPEEWEKFTQFIKVDIETWGIGNIDIGLEEVYSNEIKELIDLLYWPRYKIVSYNKEAEEILISLQWRQRFSDTVVSYYKVNLQIQEIEKIIRDNSYCSYVWDTFPSFYEGDAIVTLFSDILWRKGVGKFDPNTLQCSWFEFEWVDNIRFDLLIPYYKEWKLKVTELKY